MYKKNYILKRVIKKKQVRIKISIRFLTSYNLNFAQCFFLQKNKITASFPTYSQYCYSYFRPYNLHYILHTIVVGYYKDCMVAGLVVGCYMDCYYKDCIVEVVKCKDYASHKGYGRLAGKGCYMVGVCMVGCMIDRVGCKVVGVVGCKKCSSSVVVVEFEVSTSFF